MNRSKTLETAFLFEGFKISGMQIYPMSANRRAFLRLKGNSICDGEGGKLDDLEQVAECLFACTMEPHELLTYSDEEWSKELANFTIKSPDYLIEKFAVEIEKEGERLRLAAVESLGKDQAQ